MSPLVLIVGAAFVLVALIVFGAYWLLVAQPETEQKTKLHKRWTILMVSPSTTVSGLKKPSFHPLTPNRHANSHTR